MSDVRRVVYEPDRDLWIYEDNAEPASLADTIASLRERNSLSRSNRVVPISDEVLRDDLNFQGAINQGRLP